MFKTTEIVLDYSCHNFVNPIITLNYTFHKIPLAVFALIIPRHVRHSRDKIKSPK